MFCQVVHARLGAESSPQRAKTCQPRGVDTPTRGWKSDEERGEIGAWFVRAIGERSIEQIAKDMADRGHVHKPDYYRGIMSGTKKPGRLLLRALTEYLGSSPEKSKPSGQSELVDALNRQSNAMEALVVLLARREGITLHDLAETEQEILGRVLQGGIRTAATEAIEPDPNLDPEGPPLLGRKPLSPLSAKP